MASMPIENMRDMVKSAYPGSTWSQRVDHMKDNQIVKLYYTFRDQGKFEFDKSRQVKGQMKIKGGDF